MRIAAITVLHNDGPFILEWIAFHRLVGVTDFLIFSDNCEDSTTNLLEALATHGIVTHIPLVNLEAKNISELMKTPASEAVVSSADWLWVADVDEFPNIHVKGNTLPRLIQACGYPDAISLHRQVFANNGVETYTDGLIIDKFRHTHTPDILGTSFDIEVKTLFRVDQSLTQIGLHRPQFSNDDISWTDGSGRAVPKPFQHARKPYEKAFPAQGARRFATLNHYPLRSMDSYLVKSVQCKAQGGHDRFDVDQWRAFNDSAWEETSISRYLTTLKAELKKLYADPVIEFWHRTCVSAHRDRIEKLNSHQSTQKKRQALGSGLIANK